MAKKLSVAERYIRDVLAGKIVTSKYVRLLFERHERDLLDGPARGLVFDRRAAQHVIDFFAEFLTHPMGEELIGKPLVLEPFQQAKFWILYGWKWQASGRRRFKFAYNEISRGNAKSMEASGLCVYEFLGMGVPGVQVYSAATDKETARIVFATAVLMIQANPFLHEMVQCCKDNVHIPNTASKFEPLIADARLLLGLRPRFTSLDELHVQVNDDLWNVIVSAMGKDPNSLLYASTNSGFDQNSICFRKRDYSIKVLTQVFDDDTWFAWISGLDEKEEGKKADSWEDEKNWIKANPGIGTMVDIVELRQQAAVAKNDPSALNAFLRFRMSVWTEAHSVWMPMEKWDACKAPVDLQELRGRPCVGALDLSTVIDISAFALAFPPYGDDHRWSILVRYFLPRSSLEQRVRRDRVPYDVWERQRKFILTDGQTIDYDEIRAEIGRLKVQFEFSEICFDRWNSNEIVKDLEADGFTMIKWGQGYQEMNAPTKRLMELVLNDEVAHGADPVLRWMASNTVVKMDEGSGGFIKPDKSRSREKIDGIVAAIMALGRGMQTAPQQYSKPYILYI